MERMVASRVRLAVVVFVAFLLQVTVFVEIHPLGVAPELPLLIAICAGREGGADRGAYAGFAVGLLYDLQLASPFGLWALTCCVVAYGVGVFTQNLHQSSPWVAAVSTSLASVSGVLFFALTAALIGQEGMLDVDLLRVALLVGVVNLALSPLAGRALRWAYRPADAYRAAT